MAEDARMRGAEPGHELANSRALQAPRSRSHPPPCLARRTRRQRSAVRGRAHESSAPAAALPQRGGRAQHLVLAGGAFDADIIAQPRSSMREQGTGQPASAIGAYRINHPLTKKQLNRV